MAARTRAISYLALGLALGAPSGDAEAAPSTPPPPKTRSTSPPPPTSKGSSPFLPTPRTDAKAGSGTRTSGSTPPPPSSGASPPAPGSGGSLDDAPPSEPDQPPQDLSNTWGYSSVQTDVRPRYVRTDDPAISAPNPVGFYSGVSVQGNHVPPFPAKSMGAPPAIMTWTGFERADEGSRVFFQLSNAAEHSVDRKGQTIRIRMRNTRVNVRNNMRQLDLRYFKTPVRTVKVTRRGRDTVATIVLKRDASPEIAIVDGKAGYKLLVVQFNDSTATTTSTTTNTPPPPEPAPAS